MQSEKNSKRTKIALFFAFIGWLTSWVQTKRYFDLFTGEAELTSFCKINEIFDCTAVEASPYALLLPHFPVSSFGVFGFSILIAFLILAISSEEPRWKQSAAAISVFAFGVSLFYMGVMVFSLGKLCMLCLIVDLAIAGCFVTLLPYFPKISEWSQFVKSKKNIFLSVILGSLLISLVGQSLVSQKPMDPSRVKDIVQEILEQKRESIPERSEESISIGPQNAPITIVKFSDFQCPACLSGAKQLHPVLLRYSQKVRFVFKQFPLSSECHPKMSRVLHPAACSAARGSICAAQNGKFQEYYDKIFDRQSDLGPSVIEATLTELGLDADKQKKCISAAKTNDWIRKDVEEGTALNVNSTPTFFINGMRVSGSIPGEAWIQIIENELKKRK